MFFLCWGTTRLVTKTRLSFVIHIVLKITAVIPVTYEKVLKRIKMHDVAKLRPSFNVDN